MVISVVIVLQCTPVREAGEPSRTTWTQCVLFGILILMQELTNLFLDITILILPISVIQLPARQRWMLSLIFLLGGL